MVKINRLILFALTALALNGCYALKQLTVGPDPDPPSATTDYMAGATAYYPDGQVKCVSNVVRDGFSAPECPPEGCKVTVKTDHEACDIDVEYTFLGVDQDLQATQQGFNNQFYQQQLDYNREQFALMNARFERITRALVEGFGDQLPLDAARALLGAPPLPEPPPGQ